jgi:hypothetical protein
MRKQRRPAGALKCLNNNRMKTFWGCREVWLPGGKHQRAPLGISSKTPKLLPKTHRLKLIRLDKGHPSVSEPRFINVNVYGLATPQAIEARVSRVTLLPWRTMEFTLALPHLTRITAR